MHLDIPPVVNNVGAGRQRLVADRFRRIWHVVEDIAAHPGKSRRELADKFHLSERQIQADLNIIRAEMRLPLVRRQGYRFVAEGAPSGDSAFDLREAQLLVMILRQASRDRSIPADRLRSMMRKLPAMFPPHLQPLVARTLEAVTGRQGGREQQVFAALADGLLRGASVKLHYPPGDFSSVVSEPIVQPELLLPYLSSWYVVGHCQQRNRVMMFRVDTVSAVTLAAEPERTGRVS
ncbi:MAG: helix-turn-helix transcriptional regulator [Chloroflexota bacterium]